jgi:aspartate/methionine/tyrosine aminotransferase
MKELSVAIRAMERSGIRVIMDLAARQTDVLNLSVGEPNFQTPPHIIEAAAKAMADGYTKYTPNRGLPDVRETMAAKIAQRNGFEVGADQIVVGSGAVGGIVESLMAICNTGDAVLIPDPGWPNYAMMASLIEAQAVFYPLLPEEGFLPDFDTLDGLCRAHPNAKVLLVNSPSNPTGAVFDRSVMSSLLEVAQRHDLYVVSDECYEDIIFEGEHISPASLDDSGRVVSVFSVSKSYAMTGWRIGYAAVSPELAPLMEKLQEGLVSCANAVGQKAAQAAIQGDQTCVREMRDSYHQRRDRSVELLSEAGLLLSTPHGAFYVMADTSPTGMEGYELCRRLVTEYGVAAAPGETFGPSGTGMARISLATALDDLEAGIGRFAEAVRAWS